jgi:hypothetical protein
MSVSCQSIVLVSSVATFKAVSLLTASLIDLCQFSQLHFRHFFKLAFFSKDQLFRYLPANLPIHIPAAIDIAPAIIPAKAARIMVFLSGLAATPIPILVVDNNPSFAPKPLHEASLPYSHNVFPIDDA